MSLKPQIRKFLTGLSVPQEYCCLELEQFKSPLRIFLTLRQNSLVKEVTDSHLFLGYKPLIIGLPLANVEAMTFKEDADICLSFVEHDFNINSRWQNFPADSSAVATLELKQVAKIDLRGQLVYLYEGRRGKHSFLNTVHKRANNLMEKLKKRPVGNVPLEGNLFDQVRIAYAVPRKISVITVSDGSKINMFPTDLHNKIGSGYYAGSLRIGGKANDQVEDLKRIVISDVSASSFRRTYSLGKNHMTELQNIEQFDLHEKRSNLFDFPLPQMALKYRELLRISSVDHGIHRIHFYEIKNTEVLGESPETLAHIQQYYAQWRRDHGFNDILYFR